MGAARAGCLLCCAKFQEQAGKVVNGTTAMIQAAQNGHVDVVGLLVRKEARMQDGKGRTALMDAARLGHTEIVKLLIPHEAKMVNNNGGAAIHSAAHYGHTEIVELLVPFEAKMTTKGGATAMMYAAQNGHAKIVSLLIPYEAKMQDDTGWAALMSAAQKGHLEAAKLLLSLEAKMRNEGGWTALMSAARHGRIDVIEVLLQHEGRMVVGADITATIVAVTGYRRECFDLLLTNEKEREASRIPEVMLSAYRGDIHDLMARKHEWQTIHNGLTVLGFALLGSQRRVVKLPTSHKGPREFFVRQTIRCVASGDSSGLTFLSLHQHLLRELLPIISTAATYQRGDLLARALVQGRSVARIPRAVCTPVPKTLFKRVEECGDDAKAAQVLPNLKHLGFSSGSKTVSDFASNPDGPISQYIQSNPLRQKQIALAPREAELLDIKQPAWREVEAESRFNRDLIIGCEDAIATIAPTQRSCIAASSIARHRARLNAYRYACQKLEEELDG